MRSGYTDGTLAVHELAEHLRPPDDPHPALPRLIHLGIVPLDGGGDDDGIHAVHVGGVMTDGDSDATAQEELGRCGMAEVATDTDTPAS